MGSVIKNIRTSPRATFCQPCATTLCSRQLAQNTPRVPVGVSLTRCLETFVIFSFELSWWWTCGFSVVQGRFMYHSFILRLCSLDYLTPWNTALLKKPTVTNLVNKFPAIYGIRGLIIVFTRTYHWSLSWSSWIQSTPSHPVSLRCVLIPPISA